ncbi:MAG: putative anti-sigma regulatory factor, serine/threonine protein kinase [Frankiales bacterium]|nr:putative anti-sigma regulatory factor, serine/threonine protein kinase [Frankiales bacterium]
MTTDPSPSRTAVLRDYPLRLWEEQNQYFDGLLREFQLLLLAEQEGAAEHPAPRRLVELAELVRDRFGGLLQTTNVERQAAVDAGLDRIDSRLPLFDGLPALLDQVRDVLEETDLFCERKSLLALPRPAHLVAFATWAGEELRTQHAGGAPTPWPGPF